MTTSHVMKVSSNGQVSVPAETRSRWDADRVTIVELGDRIVIRPLPDDPVGALVGKYADRGPTSDEARHRDRAETARAESRKKR